MTSFMTKEGPGRETANMKHFTAESERCYQKRDEGHLREMDQGPILEHKGNVTG